MKLYMRPIQMIAWFEDTGKITPLKFQMVDDEKHKLTVKIDRIVLRQNEKYAGNHMLVYRCESTINHELKVYEIKYELQTSLWYLSKM